MTSSRTHAKNQSASTVAAELRAEVAKVGRARHWVVVGCDRQARDFFKAGTSAALVGGLLQRLVDSWRRLEPTSGRRRGKFPGLVVLVGLDNDTLDDAAVASGLDAIVRKFLRSHHPLPESGPGFVLRGVLISDANSLDTALGELAVLPALGRKKPPPSPEGPGLTSIDRQQAAAELQAIAEAVRRQQEPFVRRLQAVLDGLSGGALESAEANVQIVKQINALRATLGVGLRLKTNRTAVNLRCVVSERARNATIQASAADPSRSTEYAGPAFPALELYPLGPES